jgi:hypothetical protein
MTVDRKVRHGVAVMFSLVGCCLVGCDGGPTTHPVSGTLELRGGDPAQLAGHHVELTRSDDSTVRAAGVIDESGRFRIETLSGGQVKTGALEGNYQARLILNDEGDGSKKKPKINKKYLDFKTSGWTVQVPATTDVTLTLTQP